MKEYFDSVASILERIEAEEATTLARASDAVAADVSAMISAPTAGVLTKTRRARPFRPSRRCVFVNIFK